METPIPDYLAEVLEGCSDDEGRVADYIPDLASANPDRLGITLTTVDGASYHSGDTDIEVSIQSVSKPFAYALALMDRGLDEVTQRIDIEPSGDAFNEISLDADTGRPKNPMINAGAIATHALIDGRNAESRLGRFLEFVSTLAGRELSVIESVYESELGTAYRNRALANLLKTRDIIGGDPDDAVSGYTRQCSIGVTTKDLALMVATLASGGEQPITGAQVIDPSVNRQVLSVMATCGMYDEAGNWLARVGIPAKSGVSGVLIGALPGQVGIATLSPRLDDHGNSVRGVRIFERLSRDMGMHLMSPPQPGRAIVRSRREVDAETSVFELQGSVQFSQAERLLRELGDHPITTARVMFDLSRVVSINDVAMKMVAEGHRRLLLDGVEVIIDDPEGVYLGQSDLIPDDPVRAGVSADLRDSLASRVPPIRRDPLRAATSNGG